MTFKTENWRIEMENKHQRYDLAQMQSLPLSAKIIMTEQRIKQWYDALMEMYMCQ